jgi:hypothetical protein
VSAHHHEKFLGGFFWLWAWRSDQKTLSKRFAVLIKNAAGDAFFICIPALVVFPSAPQFAH